MRDCPHNRHLTVTLRSHCKCSKARTRRKKCSAQGCGRKLTIASSTLFKFSSTASEWANWLPHPCRIGEPHRLRAGGKIRRGPQVGKLATSPLPYRGSPPPLSGGQNQRWPTSGQIGYLTPAVSGSPTASERGAKSEVPHKWANWLPHPCRIGEPHRLGAEGKIRSGAQKRAAGEVDMARVRPGGKGL